MFVDRLSPIRRKKVRPQQEEKGAGDPSDQLEKVSHS